MKGYKGFHIYPALSFLLDDEIRSARLHQKISLVKDTKFILLSSGRGVLSFQGFKRL